MSDVEERWGVLGKVYRSEEHRATFACYYDELKSRYIVTVSAWWHDGSIPNIKFSKRGDFIGYIKSVQPDLKEWGL